MKTILSITAAGLFALSTLASANGQYDPDELGRLGSFA